GRRLTALGEEGRQLGRAALVLGDARTARAPGAARPGLAVFGNRLGGRLATLGRIGLGRAALAAGRLGRGLFGLHHLALGVIALVGALGLALVARLVAGELRALQGLIVIALVVALVAVVAESAVLALLDLLGLGRGNDAEIMLGVLEVVFGHHPVAGRRGVAGELDVFFRDMGGIAAHPDVRIVAFVVARERIAATTPVVIVVATVVARTLLVVLLVWSHLLASKLRQDWCGT